MKRLFFIVLWLLTTPLVFCENAAILPQSFGAWQKAPNPLKSTDPSKADTANPALLKEFGFTDMESATYTQPERKMTVKAARFSDATGSYGTFTYYKTPEMVNEKIGDQASSNGTHVLFYKGNVLVDLNLDTITAMSAADLRELASSIALQGAGQSLPTLPTYLPKQGYVKNSAKYVVGPVGFAQIDPAIPTSQVNFAKGAEVVQGDYESDQGTSRLTLISYPTPQIAIQEIKALDAAHAGEESAKPPTFFTRRSGPLVAIATGKISAAAAKTLLSSINFDATITWNQDTYVTKKDNVANLLVNVVVLIGVLFGLAIVMGIAFGGARVLLRKVFPGRFLDRPESHEFLRLDLRD